jgi:hypothetical protein
MDQKTKKLIFFIGALFVGVIFLTSYAAFGNNTLRNTSNGSSSSTTVKNVQTYFATGKTNATIVNYSEVAYITPLNLSNSSKSRLNDFVSLLQQNGTIQNYALTNNTYQVYLSNLSAYGLQQLIYNRFNSSNMVSVGATAYLRVPQSVNLYYSNSSPSISVAVPSRNYTLFLTGIKSIGTKINVTVSALIMSNGGIFNNQIRISQTEG